MDTFVPWPIPSANTEASCLKVIYLVLFSPYLATASKHVAPAVAPNRKPRDMGIHSVHIEAAVVAVRTRVRDPVVLKEIPEVVHGEGSALVDH